MCGDFLFPHHLKNFVTSGAAGDKLDAAVEVPTKQVCYFAIGMPVLRCGAHIHIKGVIALRYNPLFTTLRKYANFYQHYSVVCPSKSSSFAIASSLVERTMPSLWCAGE